MGCFKKAWFQESVVFRKAFVLKNKRAAVRIPTKTLAEPGATVGKIRGTRTSVAYGCAQRSCLLYVCSWPVTLVGAPVGIDQRSPAGAPDQRWRPGGGQPSPWQSQGLGW